MALSNRQQCDLFLDTLFAGYPEQLEILVRGLHNGPTYTGYLTIEERRRLHIFDSDLLTRKYDWFVGVLPRALHKAEMGQFTHANWLWADFDLKCGTEEQIKKACENAEMVVASGGGYHAYWRLSETAVFGQNADPREFQNALRKFQQALLPGCDPVHDLARLLRIPGTINHKYGTTVELVRCPGMERVW